MKHATLPGFTADASLQRQSSEYLARPSTGMRNGEAYPAYLHNCMDRCLDGGIDPWSCLLVCG